MKIDDTNIAIIKKLKDGRRAYSAIADEIGITENTVRTRTNKLIEDGVLQISGLIDPQFIPEMKICILGIKCRTLKLRTLAENLLSLTGVISSLVVTGKYDIILQVAVNDNIENQNLTHFLEEELNTFFDDIQDVETFVVYQSFNYRVPFIF